MDRKSIEFHRKMLKAIIRKGDHGMEYQRHEDAIRAIQAKDKLKEESLKLH